MKRFLIGLLVAASALSMVVTEAQARRMGSGGSSGRQSQSVSRHAYTPQQNQATNATSATGATSASRQAAPAATPQGATPKPASPWRGMLGGALLGLGLGALLSHFGLGGAVAGMIGTVLMVLLLGAAALFIYRMLMRKNSGAAQAGSGLRPAFAGTPDIGSRVEPYQPAALQSAAQASGAAEAPWGVPADVDVPAFVRQAKTYFIRLQAAWDKADVNDLREFTTPEMYAELKLELHGRGATANHTDVVSLEADLLGIETVGSEYLASVRFSGAIREAEHAPAEPFVEVWNLSKPVHGQGGWVLAGIQQLAG